jgi:hypothetical protein
LLVNRTTCFGVGPVRHLNDALGGDAVSADNLLAVYGTDSQNQVRSLNCLSLDPSDTVQPAAAFDRHTLSLCVRRKLQYFDIVRVQDISAIRFHAPTVFKLPGKLNKSDIRPANKSSQQPGTTN